MNLSTIASLLLFSASSSLQAQDILVPRQSRSVPASKQQEIIPYDTPWKHWISKGMLPYHRVTRADFPVNDRLYAEECAMSTFSFSFPQFNYACVQTGTQYAARVTAWKVMSGIYRDGSARKSWLTNEEIEWGLPHEQTHLDINEIHARRLGHVPLQKLPIGRGGTTQAAIDDLHKQVIVLLEKSSHEALEDQKAYDAKTANGRNKLEQKKAEMFYNARLKRESITFEAARQ